MTHDPETRLLFIIGSGRSGTTMTQEVVARHPDTGFISNLDVNLPMLDLAGRWNNLVYRMVPPALGQRDRRYLRLSPRRIHFGPSEPYRILNRKVSLAMGESYRDLTAEDVTPLLRSAYRNFFHKRMEAQRRRVFLCKLAGWPHARFLHEIFPDARFLHVVRDGRAVAESLHARPWWRGYMGPHRWQFGELSPDHLKRWEEAGKSFLVLAGLQWMILMDAFEEARAELPHDCWLDIRFEDLIAQPRDRFNDILRFAGLEWCDRFEKAFARYRFAPERADAYRKDLGETRYRALERALSDHLRRFGYEVGGPSGGAASGSEGDRTTL